MVRVAFLLAFACLADALSVRHRSLPRLAPARRRAAAPLTMSSTERSNKSKLQTIVKDKIEEDTAVKEELNIDKLDEVFASFDATPLAAASLAQVHRATLKDGTEVVVKVQRDGLVEQFDVDCKNIRFLASVADRVDPENEGVSSNWRGIADTSEGVLYREIDFLVERDAAERFRRAFEEGAGNAKPLPWVKVPKTFDEYCTSRVLVMEYVPGTKINDVPALEKMDVDLPLMSQRLTTSYLEQLARHGFFHCDPHPGNVAVDEGCPGGRLIYYDFGMMESIEPDVKKGFVDLVYSLYKNCLLYTSPSPRD